MSVNMGKNWGKRVIGLGLGLVMAAGGCDVELMERERGDVMRSGRIELIGVDGRRLADGEVYRVPLDGVQGSTSSGSAVRTRPVPLGQAVREAMVLVNDTSEPVAVSLALSEPAVGPDVRGAWTLLEPRRGVRWPLVGARLVPSGGRLDFDVEFFARDLGSSEAWLEVGWGTTRGGGMRVRLEGVGEPCADDVATPPGGSEPGETGASAQAEEKEVELAEGLGIARIPGLAAVAEHSHREPIGLLDERYRARATELAGHRRDGGAASDEAPDVEDFELLVGRDQCIGSRDEWGTVAAEPTTHERRAVGPKSDELRLSHGEPAPGRAKGKGPGPDRQWQLSDDPAGGGLVQGDGLHLAVAGEREAVRGLANGRRVGERDGLRRESPRPQELA